MGHWMRNSEKQDAGFRFNNPEGYGNISDWKATREPGHLNILEA